MKGNIMFSHSMRKLTALALIICFILSLSVCASADRYGRDNDFTYTADFENEALGTVIERYLSDRGILSEKFTMGFYDTVTGEEYYYNGDVYMEAGSMFKLPMNMIFSDMVYNGELDWDSTVGNYRLLEGMEQSIVYSSNGVSYSMLTALGKKYQQQREALGRFSEEELDDIFYKENYFTPKYMLSVLKALYTNDGGRYDQVIEFMKQASQELYFCYYEQPYTVAHKYGSWDGNLNDSAIIYGPHPMLLVVFTHNIVHDADTLAQVCRIVCDYSSYLGMQDYLAQSAVPEETPAPTPTPSPAPTPAQTEAPAETVTPALQQAAEPADGGIPVYVYVVVSACTVLAVCACVILVIRAVRTVKRRSSDEQTTHKG